MKIHPFLFKILLLLLPIWGLAQTATLKGVVLDDNENPIESVNIIAKSSGTVTNMNGFYLFKIPSNQDIQIEFTHINHKKVVATFNLKNGETFEFNPVMSSDIEQISFNNES